MTVLSLTMKLNVVIILILAAVACGSTIKDNKIVGGGIAEDGKYPFHVALRLLTLHACGGTIINKRYILTAAHCVIDYDIVSLGFYVRVGTNNVDKGGIDYKLLDKDIHVYYDPILYVNDIALMKINGEIEYTPKIQPVVIETEEVPVFTKATLIGWGLTSYPSNVPQKELKELNVSIIDTVVCKLMYAPLVENPVLRDGHICFLHQKGVGACKGDSGGAALRNGKQIGITSWSIPCAQGLPDVYTNVSNYFSWIYWGAGGDVQTRL